MYESKVVLNVLVVCKDGRGCRSGGSPERRLVGGIGRPLVSAFHDPSIHTYNADTRALYTRLHSLADNAVPGYARTHATTKRLKGQSRSTGSVTVAPGLPAAAGPHGFLQWETSTSVGDDGLGRVFLISWSVDGPRGQG